MIKKETNRLTQPNLEPTTPRLPIFTTTPRPRPRPTLPTTPAPDYDYNEDYYYYDDLGITNGEHVADLNVKAVDEDYDSNFYSYYSDDGKIKAL